MTIARVQGNARGTSNNSTTCSVTLGQTPQSGNVLVACIAVSISTGQALSVSSISQTNVTWTRQVNYNNPTYWNDVEIWLGVVGSSASSSVTVNLNIAPNYGCTVDICEYSGVATSNFLDQTATNIAYGQYPNTGTTSITTQANELWVGLCAQGNYGTSSPTNGFALLDGATNMGGMVVSYLEKIVSTNGAASSGVTIGAGSTWWFGCIATFKASGGGNQEITGDLTVDGTLYAQGDVRIDRSNTNPIIIMNKTTGDGDPEIFFRESDNNVMGLGYWHTYGKFHISDYTSNPIKDLLTIDCADHSGNIITPGSLKLTCTAPYFSTWVGGQNPLEPYLWGLQYYGGQWNWTADGNTLQLGDSLIRFKDTSFPNNTVDVGIIRGPQEPEDPILWISRHLAVKKDFICGGAATVLQGALALGSDWDATKLTGQMPQIYLAHSEGSPYPEDPKRDTLQIWRAGYAGFGNLSAGLIQGGCTKVFDEYGNTIGFAGAGDAFKVGDDCYLVDIDYANRIGIQGVQNRNEGGFRMGYNGPWLYRDGGYLRTDASFISDYSISSGSLAGSGNRSAGANSNGTLIIYSSSLQYKENVEDFQDSSWIYRLRPVTFNYKDKVLYGTEKNVGLIAEEVASLNPLFKWTNKDGKPDGVHYEWLSIPIIAELQKLRAEVDEIKASTQA
jgi:hypothetical protein